MHRSCSDYKDKGAFYKAARLISYDLPDQVQNEEELRGLQSLAKSDCIFQKRLASREDNLLYGAFVNHISKYQDKKHNESFIWTEELVEIRSSLLRRADFELQQKERFKRNIRFIKPEEREPLLREINIGVRFAKTCLFVFQEQCKEVRAKVKELKTCLVKKVDTSSPQLFIVLE